MKKLMFGLLIVSTAAVYGAPIEATLPLPVYTNDQLRALAACVQWAPHFEWTRLRTNQCLLAMKKLEATGQITTMGNRETAFFLNHTHFRGWGQTQAKEIFIRALIDDYINADDKSPALAKMDYLKVCATQLGNTAMLERFIEATEQRTTRQQEQKTK